MPRKSPFRIDLSVDEATELRRRAVKYTLPYFEVVRAKMILMAADGMDNDEIAARLDTRREVVSEAIGPRPQIVPKKHRGGCAVASWNVAPGKTEVAMVHIARGLAWSWAASSTLVNRRSGRWPAGRYPV
jgi:hypothetical protein